MGAWGHTSRHCRYCGDVGPRTRIALGWAHKRCIPESELRRQREHERAEKRARQSVLKLLFALLLAAQPADALGLDA
jgi:hypothetical protein